MYLVIVEWRDASETFYKYVTENNVPPKIWNFINNSKISHIYSDSKTYEDEIHKYYSTIEDAKFIFNWFYERSPYNHKSKCDDRWECECDYNSPKGLYNFMGVRYLGCNDDYD